MLNNDSSLAVEEAKHYINSIDFSQIIDKLEKEMGWNRKHALEICQMYRNFLYLHKKYGKTQPLPPSEDIDEFWHMHILDTKKYRTDCERIFGIYLDHYPYFGIDEKTSLKDLEYSFSTMQQLYEKEFGSPIYEIRGYCSKVASFFRRQLFRYKPKRTGLVAK